MRQLAISIVCVISLTAAAGTAVAGGPRYAPYSRPVIPHVQLLADRDFVLHFGDHLSPRVASLILRSLHDDHNFFVNEITMPPPPSDRDSDPAGDGRFDVYLMPDGTSFHGRTERGGAPISEYRQDAAASFFFLFPHDYIQQRVVAHEYFHSFQHATDTAEATGWWAEVSAEWASYSRYKYDLNESHHFDFSDTLFCSAAPMEGCYDRSYGWWPFAEYLNIRFGRTFPASVWRRQAELGRGNTDNHSRQALEERLNWRGTDLRQLFTQFAYASAFPTYGVLRRVSPTEAVAKTVVSLVPDKPCQQHRVTLEPWSIKYVKFDMGGNRRSELELAAAEDTVEVEVSATSSETLRPALIYLPNEGKRVPVITPLGTGSVTRTLGPSDSDRTVVALPNTSENTAQARITSCAHGTSAVAPGTKPSETPGDVIQAA